MYTDPLFFIFFSHMGPDRYNFLCMKNLQGYKMPMPCARECSDVTDHVSSKVNIGFRPLIKRSINEFWFGNQFIHEIILKQKITKKETT